MVTTATDLGVTMKDFEASLTSGPRSPKRTLFGLRVLPMGVVVAVTV
jgi:hypothetical protein